MSEKHVHCPACGSDNVKRNEKESFGEITLGQAFLYKEICYTCEVCHEAGDFLLETDKNYLIAQKNGQIILVKKILNDMSNVGITMAMFERLFELPTRTLTRWKNGDFSATSLALLRIIATYPWLIDIAEHRFERTYSQIKVIHIAADSINILKNNPILNYTIPQMANRDSPKFISDQIVSMGA